MKEIYVTEIPKKLQPDTLYIFTNKIPKLIEDQTMSTKLSCERDKDTGNIKYSIDDKVFTTWNRESGEPLSFEEFTSIFEAGRSSQDKEITELKIAIHLIAPWLSASLQDNECCKGYVAACEAVFKLDKWETVQDDRPHNHDDK